MMRMHDEDALNVRHKFWRADDRDILMYRYLYSHLPTCVP
jgi:hypothetical protein